MRAHGIMIKYSAATLQSFAIGLVSATVTIITTRCLSQLVDIVGAACSLLECRHQNHSMIYPYKKINK